MKKSTITFIFNAICCIAYRYNKCSDADRKRVYKKDLLDFCSYFSSVYDVSITVHQPNWSNKVFTALTIVYGSQSMTFDIYFRNANQIHPLMSL